MLLLNSYVYCSRGKTDKNIMDYLLIIKAVSALLYPLSMVFLLAIMGWFLGILRWKKLAAILKLCSVTLLLLASNPIVAKWLVQSLEQQYPQQKFVSIEKHDAILVLGGGLRIPLPPALHTQIGSGSDRFWHAVRLFRAGKADEIILSGGNIFAQPEFQGEAYYASELLQQWGVPKSAIVVEAGSRNTEQNVAIIATDLLARNIQSVLLVTSAYHMPRALHAFRRLPIKVTPAAADILVRKQSAPEILQWIPSTAALSLTTIAAHEYYGQWFADLKDFIVNG